MGGISIWQLLIIAVIVVLLFGTNKLRTLGSDLGSSIKGFKKAMGDEDKEASKQQDAEFDARPLTDKQANTANKEEAKKDKEQV
ncbi:twin-arginine translocase subunit TatA [Mixta theicola]|uniref:Sec-independent protein translocase protein TatA n=1 Tax=Mixta theicola TaxID=1458355 RepID=A0A2K1Q6D7_9GAMM|nr:Sec-independent protein translocase subunit TatA [Mixta theicola]PNS10585.1 twin-arginine translocase subunit TatA [Mixta theicola]GLR07363.1 sec-independent protein translocase protein TatA [Mixta theicola]